MASISPRTFSDSNLHIFTSSKPRFPFSLLKSPSSSLTFLSHSHYRFSGSSLCRCQNNNDNDSSSLDRRWESAINGVFKNVMKMFDDYLNAGRNQDKELTEDSMSLDVVDREKEVEDWDWERWRKHFTDVDDQERLVSILQSQLSRAISREDYEDAARLKVAIAAAATNDTVGRVMSYLDRAIEEERYTDAAFVRDNAGAGLVGWWAGVSADRNDPYGRIIHIDAEHGRYIARSYSFRQLSSSTIGAPLFEVFLTKNKKGEYKQQAVYLKREGVDRDFSFASLEPLDQSTTLKPVDPSDGQDFLLTTSADDREDDEDIDDDLDISDKSGFQNILSDMIPGIKVKVLKVTTPDKVDRDLLSKVVEQIMEEEDEEETDNELDNLTFEKDGAKGDNNEDKIINQIEKDGKNGISDGDGDDESQIAIKVVVSELREKSLNGNKSQKDIIRVPASIEKKGRLSFSFSIEGDEKKQIVSGKNLQPTLNKKPKRRAHRSVDHVMFDLAKFIGKGKIPKKVLKDVGELINITLRQSQYRQPLSGSTTFNRIEISSSPDPLNGLYIGAHGLYTSEVIHLRRKFGQWQDDEAKKGPQNLEFYEYVEAIKLTGDLYVPAGEVAFRAKVGKRYQLPHKGIIPEEFGVIARYRGQGRLAEPGFRNPRWVDGELVILDGKYIKGGPVVGFVYWAPEYQFLVFFNQLRLKH